MHCDSLVHTHIHGLGLIFIYQINRVESIIIRPIRYASQSILYYVFPAYAFQSMLNSSCPLGHPSTGALLLAQPLPSRTQSNDRGKPGGRNAHGKHHLETGHVAVNDNRLLVERKRVSNLRGARQDKRLTVDVRSDPDDVLDHLVDKGSLRAGDNVRTAETLED